MVTRFGLAPIRSSLLEPEGWRTQHVTKTQPSRLLIVVFVAFVSSLPFEGALQIGEGLVSISRLVAYAVFALALLQPNLCFRRAPRAIWWFALHVFVLAVTGLFTPALDSADLFDSILRFGQFLVLLWIGYNLFQYERVVRWSVWGFGFSCVALAGLLAGGIGVSEYHNAPGRDTVFGVGPNIVGATFALGAVALLGMVYGRTGGGRMTKLAVWSGFLVLAIAVARTGSRGSLLAMVAGLLTLMASRGSTRTRLRNGVIVLIAFALCYVVTVSFTMTAGRWQSTLEEGDTSGRVPIFRSAWSMVEEKPLLGWGQATNMYELGYRVGHSRRDTHNLLLWLLTEVGLVGTIPFCIGLAMCVRAAWRGRRGTQGLLPLALLIACLTTNLSGTNYALKWFWIILAYSLASETYLRIRKVQPTVRSAERLEPDAFAEFGTPSPVRQGWRPVSAGTVRRPETSHRPVT